MKLLADAVSSWERSDGNIPLLEFMSPTLKQASELKGKNTIIVRFTCLNDRHTDIKKPKTMQKGFMKMNRHKQ